MQRFNFPGTFWAHSIYCLRPALLLSLALGCAHADGASRPDSLAQDFEHPPASARPWVYWFWLNGNITSNGITADLEAMKHVGIGGVLIMEVNQGTPKGAADFGSPRWRQLYQHMLAEANRLGLEVNVNNDAGWCGSGAPFITPDLAMQKLVFTETNVQGPLKFAAALDQPKAVANYYRDIAVLAFPTPEGHARVPDLEGKAAFSPQHIPFHSRFEKIPAAQCIDLAQVRILTTSPGTNCFVSWDVPQGKWTILRLGHTPTGKDNHPAPEAGRGLESDKLSKAATQTIFDGIMGKLIADSKPLAGKTLVSTHIDSWETGSQNWTPRLREEFKARRGYDPLPLLPIVTGRYINSAEVTERFLWDLRQTVSDLLVQNYAGEFRRLARQNEMRLSIEAYDGTPCDDMTYAGQADEPMAEFWSWGYNTAYSCVEMSSAAHVYGKRILGAEAFTANDQERWQHDPATIKTLGDWAFCEGINRFVFHRYALQPWKDRAPGMSMGPWGLHYERTQTWWEQSAAWHEYLARCQAMLRQGLFVADICFLEPEGSPMRFTPTMPWRTGNTPERPRYNFDGCTPEVVLNRMRVRAGQIVLPDGMSYRLLVLPQVETMTPALLRKISDLVKAGATVIGPPPKRSPSLSGYPKCDERIRSLAARLWNREGMGRTVLWENRFRTPVAGDDTNRPLARATWIWRNEGKPAEAVPPGERFFRRLFDVDANWVISSADVFLTADNSFEAWLNGQPLGSGSDFKQVYHFDAKPFLKPGRNVLAIKAVNAADYANPAGVIGLVSIRSAEGPPVDLFTDRSWQAALKPPANWLTAPGPDDAWAGALELGALGMQPWGDIDKTSEPPYVYPNFDAIAGVLRRMGIPPDFEADPALRFIHRRDRDTEIYFVANSETNWLRADCAFRVTGKVPELWDPLSGKISLAPAYHQEQGRIHVPLCFEPAGSLFVVFRQTARRGQTPPAVALERDGQELLPGPGRPLSGPPPAELDLVPNTGPGLLAWEPGSYSIRFPDGKTRAVHLASLAAPQSIQGPWQVRFQPGRGAPAELTFNELTDWSQHSDPGVRYFSGTATYTKEFDVPPQNLAAGDRRFLDLGGVAVMAQVKLNGRDLGTLWKPPYQVEITGALKPGANQLEIRVVNLWINRMIGDEHLPEDSDRNPNGTLKQWPDWLNTDQPSPSGRVTFTTWRLWKKDSPLQPSGLLGPVRIRTAREVLVR